MPSDPTGIPFYNQICPCNTVDNPTPCDATWSYQIGMPNPLFGGTTYYFNPVSTFNPNATYSWDFGDGTTSTSFIGSHIYLSPGSYTVCLTVDHVENGPCTYCFTICVSDSSVISQRSSRNSSISNNNSEMLNNIKIAPNPTKDYSSLTFNLQSDSKVKIELLDATGKVINIITDSEMKNGNNNIQISTSNLAAGVYNVIIQTEKGAQTVRLTVIK